MVSNRLSFAYRSWLVRCLILAVLLLFLSMQLATHLLAEPNDFFAVTVTFDADDITPGDGICAIDSALGAGCTLRAAIQEANARPGPDTILSSYEFYHLTINSDLTITDPAGVTIQGGGSSLRTSGQTIVIAPGAQATINHLILEGGNRGYRNFGSLTLTNGAIIAKNAAIVPIGIESSGALTVTNFLITNDSGGISQAIRILGNPTSLTEIPTMTTLRNVTVRNTPAMPLLVTGDNNLIEIIDSSFDRNQWGMALFGSNQITIRNSTISNNFDGGIEMGQGSVAFPLVVNLLNSTISGNQNRPGLYLTDSSDAQRVQVLLNNVTIANNHGGSAAGGIFVPPGDGPSPVTILNSIIANNTAIPINTTLALPADCKGRLFSRGHNLFGDLSGCTVTGETATNTVGDPLLAALAFNGGPTATHAVPSGSLAVNAGNPAAPGSGGNACEARDQRGIIRPQGTTCEIGAYEAPSNSVVASPVLNSLSPTGVLAPAAALPLNLTGANFNASSRVQWNGLTFTPSAFTPTTLQTTIPASELTAGKSVTITVIDTARGLVSNGHLFTVNNPLPTVITNRPTSVRLGASVQVVITGTNFVPTSVVSTANIPLKTSFVNPQQLRVTVPAFLTIPNGKRIRLFVANPAPAGGISTNSGTLTVETVNVGIGSFASALNRPGDLSTLTLSWEHPVNWRLLENMAVRLLDENDEVVLWLSFAEEFGDKGALVLHSAEGAIAGIGFPGDDTLLVTDIGLLDLANSQIDAEPGTTAKVIYGFRFDQQAQGRTFQVEFSADDKEGNAHGFEPAGTITVPTAIFLPSITR